MKAVPVTSRMIQSVYFSQEDGQLLLRFMNGEVRRFEGVGSEIVQEMCDAPSPGHFYLDHIRKSFRRLAA